jgi:hypothetical protein
MTKLSLIDPGALHRLYQQPHSPKLPVRHPDRVRVTVTTRAMISPPECRVHTVLSEVEKEQSHLASSRNRKAGKDDEDEWRQGVRCTVGGHFPRHTNFS